jgi:hypothetical protein
MVCPVWPDSCKPDVQRIAIRDRAVNCQKSYCGRIGLKIIAAKLHRVRQLQGADTIDFEAHFVHTESISHMETKAPAIAEALSIELGSLYFAAGSAFAYLRRKRSTRPAVSISFCLPVKKG